VHGAAAEALNSKTRLLVQLVTIGIEEAQPLNSNLFADAARVSFLPHLKPLHLMPDSCIVFCGPAKRWNLLPAAVFPPRSFALSGLNWLCQWLVKSDACIRFS
jgi:hypothetical protein